MGRMSSRRTRLRGGNRRFAIQQAEFPVLGEIFPVPRNIFPASLRRELLEKSLRHSGFLL